MNILIITEFFKSHKNDVLVFKYLESLQNEGNQLKVICCDSELKSKEVFVLKLCFDLNYKDIVLNKWYSYFYKIFLVLFHKSFSQYLFRDDFDFLSDQLKKEGFSPDLVFQFTGGAYEAFLFDLSKKFSIEYKVPYFIHSFDPIPNTPEWGEKPVIRNATIKLLTQYIKSAHRVSAVSPRMTAYFKETYGLAPEKMYTLYMPIEYQKVDLKKTDRISFLYLGNIYGMRDPKPMFSAFNQLMGENSKIELVLAGTKLNKEVLINEFPNFKGGLKFINWTDQPDELIKNCSVLIDLNADIPGDVFISSKLMRYLGFDKPVLVIGNTESASYDFSQKFTGTFYCSNSEAEILKAITKILNEKDGLIYRQLEVEFYSAENLMNDYLKK